MINVSEQELEASEFFIEFDETYMAFQECVKLEAKNKISSVELKSSDAYDYINGRKPSPSQVYAAMCESGCLVQFTETMKLLIALLVPPSTSGVERGFSVMKLIISLLRTSLNQTDIDHFMRICTKGPEKLSDDGLEKLVDNYKNSGNCGIRL